MGHTASTQLNELTVLFLLGDAFLPTSVRVAPPTWRICTLPQGPRTVSVTRSYTPWIQSETQSWLQRLWKWRKLGRKKQEWVKETMSKVIVRANLCTWLSEPKVPWPFPDKTQEQQGWKEFLRLDNRHSRPFPGSLAVLFHPAKPSLLHLYPWGIWPSVPHVYWGWSL